MFVDPPYLLNNVYDTVHKAEYILKLIKCINTFESKILSVLGNHILLNTFYEHFNLKIKFETEIRLLKHKKLTKYLIFLIINLFFKCIMFLFIQFRNIKTVKQL